MWFFCPSKILMWGSNFLWQSKSITCNSKEDVGKVRSETNIIQVNVYQKFLITSLVHENCKLRTWRKYVVYTNCFCVLTFRTTYVHKMFYPCSPHVLSLHFHVHSMNNLLSYCGLVYARISASEKDLPVKGIDKFRKNKTTIIR